MTLTGWTRRAVLFAIAAALLQAAPPPPDTVQGAARIVVLGDVHGDFQQFLAALRGAGLIDAKNKWIGGKTHFVQLGDIPDRGPDSRKVFDLIMDLQKQAAKAGGAVHPLIGNHEAMNIYGDLRYTTSGEFAAFKTPGSEEVRQRFYEEDVAAQKKQGGTVDAAFKTKWMEQHPLGWFEQRYEFGPKGKYFAWIVGNNAVLKVNDTLFLHGGISPEYVDQAREQMNDSIREELTDWSKLPGGIVQDENGPLWYRGLAQGNEEELAPHVDAVLAQHGVKRIVIGHTPTPGAIIPRFGGKVVMADVGLSAYYGSRMALLVIEGDQAYSLHRGKKLTLPNGTKDDMLRYLKEAAQLDPAPSPLLPLIQKLESAQ